MSRGFFFMHFLFRQISVAAVSLRNEYLQTVSIQQVTVQLCSIALHEKDRLRASALRTITDIIPQLAPAQLDANTANIAWTNIFKK